MLGTLCLILVQIPFSWEAVYQQLGAFYPLFGKNFQPTYCSDVYLFVNQRLVKLHNHFYTPIHRCKSSDWLKEGHMT